MLLLLLSIVILTQQILHIFIIQTLFIRITHTINILQVINSIIFLQLALGH